MGRRFPWKPVVFAVSLLPLGYLAWKAQAGLLGANPIEAVTRFLGDWALRFLLVTLALTPLRRISGWGWPQRYRRMMGLYAFFYAALHVMSYVGLDQFFDAQAIFKDVIKRNYITFGFLTLVLLIPLAATSTKGMIRRLGGRRWRMLHRLVYPAGILAVIHYLFMVKADIREPLIYGAILAVLLGHRMITAARAFPPPAAARRS